MKCTKCGFELKPGAKFCGKCGTFVAVSSSTTVVCCPSCGADLKPGAKFCGKCGTPINTSDKYFCKKCGAEMKSGSQFCPACGAIAIGIGTTGITIGKALGNHFERGSRKIKDIFRASTTSTSTIRTERDRSKKILMLLMFIGICMIAFGIFGAIMKSGLQRELKSGLGEYRYIINEKDFWTFLSSLIRNDRKGMEKVISNYSDFFGFFDSFGVGINSSSVSSMAATLLSNARSFMKDELGGRWYLLYMVVIGDILLIPGIIITIGSVTGCYLLGGSIEEIKDPQFRPALYITAGWIGLMIILTIIGVFSIHNIDLSGIETLF